MGFALADDVTTPIWQSSDTLKAMDKLSSSGWVDGVGKLANWAGPVLSGVSAFDYSIKMYDKADFGDYFREWGKVGTDAVMAGASANPIGLAVATAYGVADYFVSDYSYTPLRPIDGVFTKRTGWTALGYASLDSYEANLKANQQIQGIQWSPFGHGNKL